MSFEKFQRKQNALNQLSQALEIIGQHVGELSIEELKGFKDGLKQAFKNAPKSNEGLSPNGDSAEDRPRMLRPANLAAAIATGDLAGKSATECCRIILREQGPMNALSIAREALARGYKGKAEGTPDEVLAVTHKSFWARLSTSDEFERPEGSDKYRLRQPTGDDAP